MLFEIQIFTWLPYARIENHFWNLPDKNRFGPASSGPYFEGDRFVIPPSSAAEMKSRTVRARQKLELHIQEWGKEFPPRSTGVIAEPFHVLAEDLRTRVYGETGAVVKSLSRAGYNPQLDAYEIAMAGEATIPFLVEAAEASQQALTPNSSPITTEKIEPALIADKPNARETVPALGWNLQLIIQKGKKPAPPASIQNLDQSKRFFSYIQGLGPDTGNQIAGKISIRLFASYVVYATLNRGGDAAGAFSIPLFYADGFGRNISNIFVWSQSDLRTVWW